MSDSTCGATTQDPGGGGRRTTACLERFVGLDTPSKPTTLQRFARAGLSGIAAGITLEDSAHATLDSAVVERTFIAPGVRQMVVRDRGRRAHFFTPARTPAPGVLVLGGSEGGFPDDVAALLAGNGYSALSLAYFGADDLPNELAEIPIEYVERAIAWLRDRPAVTRDRVAIFGTSRVPKQLSSWPAARPP